MSYDDERPTGDELVRKLRRRNILLAAALFGLAVPVIFLHQCVLGAKVRPG